MKENLKPIVVVSKCLGFAACRYNGATIPDALVDALKKYVEYRPVCPEVEIGLGVPREPIRIVTENGMLKLCQPATKKDVTDDMTSFASRFLSSVKDVDGFVLKFRSPSCGLKGVKVYPSMEKSMQVATAPGFFGAEVLKRFAFYPVEDEGRLKNFGIREHFLTKLYAFASFRKLKGEPTMGGLVKFHARNKLLLMAYSQKELKILGQIVANHDKLPLKQVIELYQAHCYNALMKQPKPEHAINVLTHALGYFKALGKEEKSYFLGTLDKYKNKKLPLSVPLALLKSYIARFGQQYLEDQTFFEPYPEELIEVTDSGKGRDVMR